MKYGCFIRVYAYETRLLPVVTTEKPLIAEYFICSCSTFCTMCLYTILRFTFSWQYLYNETVLLRF